MISNNLNVGFGIVDCSLHTRCIALKDGYHNKKLNMFAYTPVEYKYLEALAKTFIIPARQNQFFQENLLNKAPVRRIATARNTNSALTRSCTENPSGNNKSTSDKLEYSEEVNHSLTLIPLIIVGYMLRQ